MSLVGVPYCFVLSLLGQLWSTRHPDVVLNSNAFQIRGLTLVKSFLSKLSIEFLRASTFLPSIHPSSAMHRQSTSDSSDPDTKTMMGTTTTIIVIDHLTFTQAYACIRISLLYCSISFRCPLLYQTYQRSCRQLNLER